MSIYMIPYYCPMCSRYVEHSSSGSRQDTCRCHTHLHWRQGNFFVQNNIIGKGFHLSPNLINVVGEITLKSSYRHFTGTANVNVKSSSFNPIIPSLFLNSIYPGGGQICPPPKKCPIMGGRFQNWVGTSYLTEIDARQKDLPLSDT